MVKTNAEYIQKHRKKVKRVELTFYLDRAEDLKLLEMLRNIAKGDDKNMTDRDCDKKLPQLIKQRIKN